ncbi:dimer_Tnp_hAT domain-containing protein [Trichonephila clavipes]|nr:dimer_Tnp_hAT domain-containing protein [Trichonephila clavipes]
MASSTTTKKVQDSKYSTEFQTWWADKYGMINKGDKAVCVLCSGTVKSFGPKNFQRIFQFKELETFKFIRPDVISFDKLNLSQFDWLEIEELEMQLIDFQSDCENYL